ncbi:ABC transporter substrate-binding protein [Alkaliphilus sp. MSJ-5]|uniref:ABC transporter substrate-binding protein n=2 Tax=Alkaliphilus flagellatus TaxID=2841507 RepID=A0ABS6G1Y3_9FIRM|nr:ABC transporter substrate-binding protein [Alkaliphilus flagellatus]MBU5675737.1 ABC transporter substrate-binding protein [Alkaliphilus flagellatus]
MNLKRLALLLTIVMALFLITGCSGEKGTTDIPINNDENITSEEFDPNTDFDKILEEAKGSTVNFYGWGGDEDRNRWLNQTVAPVLKEKYDITLEVVGMDIDNILAKLAGEKQAGLKEGTIDMIWINGENFYSAKENDLLFGSFAEQLPNFEKYIDGDDVEVKYDFGFPIEGYEAPYGKAQMVFINDSAITEETPRNAEEFMEYAKKYEGRITYPALPDFTGSAFVRTLIYDIVGHEQFLDMEANKEVVKEAIEPALEYLRELNKYLWNQGKTFPATSGEVDNMFEDGELVMTMSYGSYSAAVGIEKGIYNDTVQTFLFDKGTVGNTNYIAIANNSPNKAAAMVAINEIISAEIQATQFKELRSLPVVSYDKLTDEEKARFDNIDIGKGALPQDELLSKRLPEMPANIVPIIEQLWLEEVVGK